MHVVVINKDQQDFVKPMIDALCPAVPLFVFDRCEPAEGCKYVKNVSGTGFLAGKMRDLGAEGIDDDILFLDGDKVPQGDILTDIEQLKSKYDCICYGVEGKHEHSCLRGFMVEDGKDGVVPWQKSGAPFATGCYTCGMWICREGIRKLRMLNGGRIFHPAFDGTWGDEDNFVADELHYSGYRIGYSTHVRLGGRLSPCNDPMKMEGFARNFIKRVHLRRNLLNAPV